MITLLLQLLLAHIVGDFLLQPHSWVVQKERKKVTAWPLYAHVLLHIALIMLFTWDREMWLPALLLGLVHGIIDLIKLYAQKATTKRSWFFIDQALHLICIVLVWLWLRPEAITIWPTLFQTQNLLYLLAYVFVTIPAAIIIKVIIGKWQPDVDIQNSRTTETPGTYHYLEANKTATAPQSLQDAGKYIGMLERVFILTFLLVGHWEAIGFLLAAKSIFRFSDLKVAKDRKLTEYMIIGTFVSVGIAIGTGLLVQYVLTLL